jgi:acyl-CoA synthetase (AMP-forming)/AMP-acid ligase II
VAFLSPHPDVEIPSVALTAFVLGGAAERGDKPALVDGPSGRVVTYAQLADQVRRAAAGLARRGLRRGDVLAIYCPNLPEYAVAFHAVALLGAVNTTVNPLYTPDELRFQLADTGARHLLTVPGFLDRALEGARGTAVEEVFVVGGDAAGITPFSALLEDDGAPPAVEIDPAEDLAVLPYSSGTTGLPKGVMLTHANVVADICQARAVQRISGGDTLIGVLPFFHIYGMTVIMNMGLSRGATIVTMPRFELQAFLELVERHRVTRAYVVPPIVLALAKDPVVDEYDLSSVQLVLSGAAPLAPELARALAERLGVLVVQGYGLTETSPVTHSMPERLSAIRPGSVGPALPGTETRVTDPETGAELGPGEAGEVWIRGPQVMKGYLNNEEATRETIDAEGWLRTGDIGYVDEDGYLYLVDRLKELIKYKGYQVAPAELEAILVAHPAVADVAVVGSPDEEAGEVPKAFVVPAGSASPEEIMSFVAERVSPQKKVRRLEFVEAIPKSPSGKILRRLLVERERAVE